MPIRRTSNKSSQDTGYYNPEVYSDVGSRIVNDEDVVTYISAVEAQDGQSLEAGVKTAYSNFILGCKADGIWSSIKSSCILGGARTISGALVPLVGLAPTNIGFIPGDYDRKLGITGDKSSYLNTNYSGRLATSQHLVVQKTSNNTSNGTYSQLAGVIDAFNGAWSFLRSQSAAAGGRLEYGISPGAGLFTNTQSVSSFVGQVQSGTSFTATQSAGNEVDTATQTPTVPSGVHPVYIFADNNVGTVRFQSDFRIFFYSIGESVDLAKFQARVSGLLVQISGAIA